MSDYLVFIDESGDHGVTAVPSPFPLLVLALVIVRRDRYMNEVLPAVTAFKLRYFKHEGVNLHEREIRKREGPFKILTQPSVAESFMAELNAMMDTLPIDVVACVIDKRHYRPPAPPATLNLYETALTFGLERVAKHVSSYGAITPAHVLLECRGKAEDNALELEFRRICDGANWTKQQFPFTPEFLPKSANVAGLQIADLLAKPIGQRVLRPDQPNRAADIAWRKLRKNPANGDIDGYGLKVYPSNPFR